MKSYIEKLVLTSKIVQKNQIEFRFQKNIALFKMFIAQNKRGIFFQPKISFYLLI